jgi:YgiT-type zinc finger domain-containing protein
MADWYCFVDKEKMVEAQLTLSYMMITQRVPGLKCPVCGVEYLTEKFVMTTVKDAETLLESK